ncbi:hypothetical protein AGMMS49574_05430 [Bacteroidia bacterium]|nr:hypothetical protein AGMMS49574_05430 [Bacteroidia bacterium]
MARKVFISVLGSTNYGECFYKKGEFKSAKVRYIQEATLDYLTKNEEWNENDEVLILVTDGDDGSKIKNWLDNGHINRDTKSIIELNGLKTRLENLQLPVQITPIEIPDGDTEEEIWQIFEKSFEQVEDEDELYFDITHGFRYLPMLILVLVNYSKFLKNIKVKSITYGNYEGRNKETNESPIIDLLPLSVLQDWTFAAGDYLKNGNIQPLQDLANSNLQPILREAEGTNIEASRLKQFINAIANCVEDFQMCRGMNIVQATNLKNAKPGEVKSIIKPLTPIIDKVKSEFDCFDSDKNVNNGFQAAKWSYDNGLFQQAATILQENITTFFCLRHNMKIDDENKRKCVNKAFNIKTNGNENNLDKWKVDIELIPLIKEILLDDNLNNNEIIDAFSNLTEVRNDFNHSGMRSRRPPMKPSDIKKNIKKCIDVFMRFTSNQTIKSPDRFKSNNCNPILINLSNHPSANWQPAQLEAASAYGEIIDIPFPEVDPTGDEEYIQLLCNEYVAKVMQYAEGCKPVVHLMGEMTFTFCLVKALQAKGIECIASTTERIVSEIGADYREVQFVFAKFRKYI